MVSMSSGKVRQHLMTVIVSVFAAFGGFLYGYDTGIISGVLDMNYFKKTFGHLQINETYELAANDKSLIVSMLSAGTFFGALLGYPIGDFIGRRWGLILACLIFAIGVAFQTFSQILTLLVVGRGVAGVGVGIISCLVPMYQSECSPKSIRGAIVSIYQWCITIGLLIASIVNNLTKDIDSNFSYKIPISIQFIWATILAIGMLILPESPRYLVLKNRLDQAYKSQARLVSRQADDPQVKADINELLVSTEAAKAYGSSTYADCFRLGPQKNLYRTLVGIFLQAWQQLSGINFIFYYGTTFFSSAGISNPYSVTVAINLVNVIMTIPGILLIDRLGRRNILIIGAIGMSFSEYTIAIVENIVGPSDNTGKTILIVFSCIFIGFFASSWGPTTWVVTSELYPTSIRAKCMSLSTASNWLFNFLLAYITPYLVDPDKANLGLQIFYVWGTTSLGCLIFSIFCVWETKGLSLEQVNYLVRNSSPITSNKLNKQIKQGIIMDSDIINSNDPAIIPMTSLDGIMDKPNISTDTDDSNEKTSLLEKIK